MPLHLEWSEIGLRLGLSLVAGAVIGLNRGGRGRRAGLRTTMLVCLAATIAMIQLNILLPISGKPPTSFVTLDLMRLPLGILSGIGFIGAGAIIRRGNLVEGVTTAATLWYVTVMGLCFGGGQLRLGLAALAIGALILWCLKWFEGWIGFSRQASLLIIFDPAALAERSAIDRALRRAGYEVAAQSLGFGESGERCEIRYELRRHKFGRDEAPEIARQLARRSAVRRLEWRQTGEA
jgi:putative Mg2+ transporter-C (MgtC) family protein